MRYPQRNGFTDAVFYFIDVVLQWIYSLFKASPTNFIEVETVLNDKTIAMKDGTLLSAIEIEGISKTVQAEDLDNIVAQTNTKLMAYMSDGCHYVSFYFHRDYEDTRAELENGYGMARYTAQRIGLDVDDLIDEQVDVLARLCQSEKTFLLFWTNMDGLSKEEKKIAMKERIKRRKGLPLSNDAQDIGMDASTMQTKHESFVSEFAQDLKTLQITTRAMPARELLKEMRLSIDPQWTAPEWQPCIPCDPTPYRLQSGSYPDSSGMFWPRLEAQIFPRDAQIADHATVVVGNKIYAPVTIDLMPKSVEGFQSLFRRLRKEGIPWRIHMHLRSKGDKKLMNFNQMLADFLMFSGAPENRYLADTKEQLIELRDSGQELVKFQIALCTWAPADDLSLIDKRRAILARCVQGWGVCDVAPAAGDPLESMMSSTPGAILGSIGKEAVAPMFEAIRMAPLSRPASAWKTGSQPLRTIDGKLMPYQPYSKQQTSWVSLIFAPMGYGKSVFMNYSNLSLILSPELTELPFISIIDVGPSSRGLISLIKNALPEEKKHMALYERLVNTSEYAINVFDTFLGLRQPLANHRAFLVNFLTYIATPEDAELPPDGTSGIAAEAVKLAYLAKSDRTTARAYQTSVLPEIDAFLDGCGFKADGQRTKWWDIVDYLYSKGETRLAGLAQRYAVPTLKDIAYVVNDKRIESIYGDTAVSSTGEPLIKFFYRKLTEAINKYPIISEETKFDLGEARIVSIDLDEVARGSGPDAKRRTGLMYLLTYYLLTQKFFFGKDNLKEMEGEVGLLKTDYRPYHKKVIESIAKLPKRFCIDEKHRVKGLPLIENQLDTSILEGRKWKVEIMQATQLPDDFSERSRRLATNVFILGAGNAANAEVIAEQFELSEAMKYHLIHSLRRPNKDGSTLLALIETDRGNYEQFLMSSQGPTFLWACNSSRDDAYVRDRIASEIGDVQARKMLVEFYPQGNLDDEIDKRKEGIVLQDRKKILAEQSLSGQGTVDDETPPGILNEIADEIVDEYRRRQELSNSFKYAQIPMSA